MICLNDYSRTHNNISTDTRKCLAFILFFKSCCIQELANSYICFYTTLIWLYIVDSYDFFRHTTKSLLLKAILVSIQYFIEK